MVIQMKNFKYLSYKDANFKEKMLEMIRYRIISTLQINIEGQIQIIDPYMEKELSREYVSVWEFPTPAKIGGSFFLNELKYTYVKDGVVETINLSDDLILFRLARYYLSLLIFDFDRYKYEVFCHALRNIRWDLRLYKGNGSHWYNKMTPVLYFDLSNHHVKIVVFDEENNSRLTSSLLEVTTDKDGVFYAGWCGDERNKLRDVDGKALITGLDKMNQIRRFGDSNITFIDTTFIRYDKTPEVDKYILKHNQAFVKALNEDCGLIIDGGEIHECLKKYIVDYTRIFSISSSNTVVIHGVNPEFRHDTGITVSERALLELAIVNVLLGIATNYSYFDIKNVDKLVLYLRNFLLTAKKFTNLETGSIHIRGDNITYYLGTNSSVTFKVVRIGTYRGALSVTKSDDEATLYEYNHTVNQFVDFLSEHNSLPIVVNL